MATARRWMPAAAGVAWVACCLSLPVEATAQEREIDLRALRGRKTVLSAAGARDVDASARRVTIGPGEYVMARWADEAERVSPVVTDAKAREIPEAPSPSPPPAPDSTPPTTAGEDALPRQALDRQAWALPYGFIGVTREGREVRFRPVVESAGLFVSSDGSEFRGLIHVGLQDLKDPTLVHDLPDPINLLVNAQAQDVSPRQLTLNHTSLPFEEVTIRADDPADPFEIDVQASGASDHAVVRLPVVRPRLELSIARRRIQGFGLETSEITVRATGLREPVGRVVTLESGTGTEPVGSLEAAQVRLDEQGVGSTTIRSASVGASTIAAASPPFAPARAVIAFVWPLSFLVAALLGGVAGAFLGRRRPQNTERHGLLFVLGVGALTGIVAVVLYAVGVNVLPVQPVATAGEALVFAVAAVAGYVGLRL